MQGDLAGRLGAIADASGLTGAATGIAARGSGGESVTFELRGTDEKEPVTPASVMYGASLAKQVVGILLASEVCAGTLDPDSRVHELLDLPRWAEDIRIRHLVHHTSGMPRLDPGVPGRTNQGVLEALRAMPAAEAPVGVQSVYCNTGYVCLAEILVGSTGRSFEELAMTSLFAPLGMTATCFSTEPVVERQGHVQPPGTLGDGGLWTTAADLLRWNDAMNARALGAPVHELSESPGSLDDGTPLDYAWGVRVLDRHGVRTLSHGGWWPTWTSKTVRQPQSGASVAVMSSSDDATAVTDVALELLDVLAQA